MVKAASEDYMNNELKKLSSAQIKEFKRILNTDDVPFDEMVKRAKQVKDKR